jgi:hypothetical protein
VRIAAASVSETTNIPAAWARRSGRASRSAGNMSGHERGARFRAGGGNKRSAPGEVRGPRRHHARSNIACDHPSLSLGSGMRLHRPSPHVHDRRPRANGGGRSIPVRSVFCPPAYTPVRARFWLVGLNCKDQCSLSAGVGQALPRQRRGGRP